MARFRKLRARARSAFRSIKKSRKATSSGGLLADTLTGTGYGAIRNTAANLLSPVISMVPAGAYSDELVMGAIGYLLAKNTSGMTSRIGRVALICEGYRTGETLGSGLLGGSSAAGNTTNFG